MEESLILVFYIDRETSEQTQIREQYLEGVQKHFRDKNLNPSIFFFPTDDGNERLECINPRYIEDQNEVEKLKKLLSDVEKTFDIQNNTSNKNGRVYPKVFSNLEGFFDHLESNEDSDDPLDIVYSDLTEDMRNKIAYYDKKYNEHLKLLIEMSKTKIERGNDFEPIEQLLKHPDTKKGHLFNQAFRNSQFPFTSYPNKELYEIIEKLGDNPKIWACDVPAFVYDGEAYSVMEKYVDDINSVYEMIDKMNSPVVLYNILVKEFDLYNMKTVEPAPQKRYMIRYRELDKTKVS